MSNQLQLAMQRARQPNEMSTRSRRLAKFKVTGDFSKYTMPCLSGAGVEYGATGETLATRYGAVVRTTGQIVSRGRAEPWAQQGAITVSARILPHETARRKAMVRAGERLLAPPSTNPADFDTMKGQVCWSFAPEAGSLMGYARIVAKDCHTTIPVHTIANGLPARFAHAPIMLGVLETKRSPESGRENEDVTVHKAGTQSVPNTGTRTATAGDIMYVDLNPPKCEVDGVVKPLVVLGGQSPTAFYPQTRVLRSSDFVTMLTAMKANCLIALSQRSEDMQKAKSARDISAIFLEIVRIECEKEDMSEYMPMRAQLRVWLPWHWCQMVKLREHVSFLDTEDEGSKLLSRILHGRMALECYCLIAGEEEKMLSDRSEQFGTVLPNHMVDSPNTSNLVVSVNAPHLTKLLDESEFLIELAANNYAQLDLRMGKAEAHLTLLHERTMSIYQELQYEFLRSRILGKALTSALPGADFLCLLKC